VNLTYNSQSLPPGSHDLARHLTASARRLIGLLDRLDLSKLPVSWHAKRSIASLKTSYRSVFTKYVQLLSWATHQAGGPNSVVLLDHGGGLGIMACLARAAGAAVVLYNDLASASCDDAEALGKAIDCPADAYLCGGLEEAIPTVNASPNLWASVVSINVIEHIYDLDASLRATAELEHGGATLVLSTSANPLNPLVRRKHHLQHREWELEDGPHEGSAPHDSARAFRTIRREIVMQRAPLLKPAEVEELVATTRGRRIADIDACVDHYKSTGQMLFRPDHPTNTCDPITGNWQERLLSIVEVRKTLSSLGFQVSLRPGYYDGNARNPLARVTKQPLTSLMNHLINATGANGLRLAPCFFFHACRLRRSRNQLKHKHG
jgi:hypothetical protein